MMPGRGGADLKPKAEGDALKKEEGAEGDVHAAPHGPVVKMEAGAGPVKMEVDDAVTAGAWSGGAGECSRRGINNGGKG